MAKKSKSIKSNAFDNDESVREQIKEVIEEALYRTPCCANCGSSNTMGDEDGYITCSDCGYGWNLLEDYNLPTDMFYDEVVE